MVFTDHWPFVLGRASVSVAFDGVPLKHYVTDRACSQETTEAWLNTTVVDSDLLALRPV